MLPPVTETPSEETSAPHYDALLLVSFGGPEKPEDVMPFLRNVVRGKRVPEERLLEVAEHYQELGGKSPINEQNRALLTALETELREHDIDLPIYWGNRNWNPTIAEALEKMRDDGVTRALALVTSAFGSYSGCRQYKENIEAARAEIEGAPEVDKLRLYFNHPGFVEATVERISDAFDALPEGQQGRGRIAFTAHSIPCSMAKTSPYQEQLTDFCETLAGKLGRSDWQLVFQSRSGPPRVPWLEPDILDHIQALDLIGVDTLVIAPIGFISDHVEVIWDLDNEAAELCDELGIEMRRAGTVGTHPAFVAGLRELVQERLGTAERRRALGKLGPWPDECPPDCCKYEPRRPTPEEGTSKPVKVKKPKK